MCLEHPIPDPVDTMRDWPDGGLVVDAQMELVLKETIDLEQQIPKLLLVVKQHQYVIHITHIVFDFERVLSELIEMIE